MKSNPPFVKREMTVAAGSLASFIKQEQRPHLQWNISPIEISLIHAIVKRANERAAEVGLPQLEPFAACMDLATAHCCDKPFNLQALLQAPDVDDVINVIGAVGVRIDRTTGKLAGDWRCKFHAPMN
jgi:hypothetical protein